MRWAAATATPVAALLLGSGQSAEASRPTLDDPGQQRSSDNPLAGRPWAVYQGPGDQAWTDEFTAGIGTAHAAVVLQPDLAKALGILAPRGTSDR